MKDLINGQPEQDIDHCGNCIHDADSVDICVLRKCKYAIAELIDCYEPKQLEQPWIPCSERLPEKNCRCLTTNTAWGAFEVDFNVWINGEWLYPNEKPIAWMPLPEPYSEVSE